MHAWVLVVLAGCGRVGFDGRAIDATTPDVVDSSLVAWFPLDTVVDKIVENRVNPAMRGTCMDSCPPPTTGVRDTGLLFNTGNGVRVEDAPSLRITRGTFAMWVRFDVFNETPVYQSLIAKPYANTIFNSFELYLRRIDASVWEFRAGGGEGDAGSFAELTWSAPVATWTHVALTFDPDDLRFYVDGTLRQQSGGYVPLYDDSELIFGCDRDSDTIVAPLNGALDDIRIYSRVLSQNEIAALAAR